MIWFVHGSKVFALVFGLLLILPSILSNVAAESITAAPSEAHAVMKHTKKMTLVSIKNEGDEPMYAIVLENPRGDIRFVKAKGWDRERIDAGKVRVVTDDRPVMPGNKLVILLITRTPATALIWSAADESGNAIVTGVVIERSPKSEEETGPEEITPPTPQPSIPTEEVIVTVSTETASFTHNEGESSCPQYIETVIIESKDPVSLEVADKPDWLDLQLEGDAVLLYYNCPEGASGALSGKVSLTAEDLEGRVVDTININVTGQVNMASPPPPPPEVQVSVNTTAVSFTHDIDQSSCPQYIETVAIDSNNEPLSLEVVDKPDWLTLRVDEAELVLYYNCPDEQAAGALSGILVLSLKSDGSVIDTINIEINGQLIPPVVDPPQEGPLQKKTYTLLGDGYIQGEAEITCWQYGRQSQSQKIHITIDVIDVFRNKGRNLISAFIIDLTKNGPDSYIQIGESVFPRQDYDYVAFSGSFDSEDFPATANNDPCPIGNVGRIVIVVGTTPPSDEDTLSEGSVDIVAATTSGTAETGEL